jgi:hypothetical protein
MPGGFTGARINPVRITPIIAVLQKDHMGAVDEARSPPAPTRWSSTMILTILVAFAALVIADLVGALLAPLNGSSERLLQRCQFCLSRIATSFPKSRLS